MLTEEKIKSLRYKAGRFSNVDDYLRNLETYKGMIVKLKRGDGFTLDMRRPQSLQTCEIAIGNPGDQTCACLIAEIEKGIVLLEEHILELCQD